MFEKSEFQKIEGGKKSSLIYDVLFYDNQESKQKYYIWHSCQFFSFHLNGLYSRLRS